MNAAKVIIDSPARNSSLIYITNYYCLDPFIFVEYKNKKIGWLPSTEFENAKKKSSLNKIYNLSEEYKALSIANKKCLPSNILLKWLIKNNIKKIVVPYNFPLFEADNLRNNDIDVLSLEEPFYESRVSKNQNEIEFIKENSRKNSHIMKSVYNILAESKITNNKMLKYNGELLTSEALQNFILNQFINNDLISDTVIVAVGDQGCFPHEHGSGYIYADKSIIVDIFPKSRKNLYYTDMTRTFCKGKASYELKKIYNTVYEAQKLGIELIQKNADGKKIHNLIQNYFKKQGFKTRVINGILQGFIHGTGHGLGLDCHELPYISANGNILPENAIVSVEPGLYYLGIGGVRIEDLVVVRDKYAENLTLFEKKLEIE